MREGSSLFGVLYQIAELSFNFNFNFNLVESWDVFILNSSTPATHPTTHPWKSSEYVSWTWTSTNTNLNLNLNLNQILNPNLN